MVSKFRKVTGGAERHLIDVVNGLGNRGHDVRLFSSEDVESAGGVVFQASATGIEKAKAARALLWNSRARCELGRLVKDFKPDIVHYHSIYHQLSPSVLGVFDGPTLMTLHDYKLSAPCYSLYRNGEVCQDCVGRAVPTPAIRHRCIGNSRAGSAVCALEQVAYRHRYLTSVDRFIVPSRFAYDVAVRGGLPPDRITVIPWGVAVERRDQPYSHNVVFFGGRLDPVKGIDLVLEAWQSLGIGREEAILRIAGQGDLESLVRSVSARNDSVEFCGMLSGHQTVEQVRGAALALVPSTFPETMGLSAVEALVVGTPVVSSGRGALSDLSGPGVWTLPRVDVQSIRSALVSLVLKQGELAYREELSRRDLSLYRFDRMIDAVEAEYLVAGSSRVTGAGT